MNSPMISTRNFIRISAFLTVSLMVLGGCKSCIDRTIPPGATENAAFCAQYLGNNQLVEAEARCKLSIEYSSTYAEPYNLLGLIEYNRGHTDLAIQHFKQALSLRDDFAEAYNNLGALFMGRREYPAACDQFRQAIEIDPGYVDARVNLAACLYYSKDTDKARDEYLKCVELDPNSCDCRLGLGVLSSEKNDFSEAKVHFERLIEICPDNASAYYNLCWANYKLQRCKDAVDACTRAISLNENFPEAKQTLAHS
ncbi:tetratricopeptide repeat protein, partial [Myxococcota bacterium]|nr:tetratricopeptide repeat protein [Myxococcota bacterium]